MHKLIIAPSAEADLNAIVDYIAGELCNPEAAVSLIDEIEAAYDSIEDRPLAFPFCADEFLRQRGYHQVSVRNYIMIYREEKDEAIVRVLHFYHGTQDYLKRFLSEN